jgi:hypothetical protein
MLDRSHSSARDPRGLVIRLFLKSVIGLALVFALATIVAPALFDRRDDLMVAAAFALWLACPLILFLVGFEVFADLKKFSRRPL